MRSNQRRLVWILLAAAVLLLIVAVVSVVLYLVLRQAPADIIGWQDPMGEISPGEIVPELALYPLAGASAIETLDAALANGDLETAYAALVFGLDLSDAQRIGRLVILGKRLGGAEKPELAARTYQQVYDIATISPGLTDAARADALLSAGKGWAELEFVHDAVSAYDQVFVLAAYSPYLQVVQRRELFEALKSAHLGLGDVERADAIQQRIFDLEQTVQQPPVMPSKQPDLPTRSGAVSSSEIGILEEARRQAAFSLIQSYSTGGEPPADRVQTLASALQAEDVAKLAFYGQELEQTTQSSRRIDVLWSKIRWLTLKSQVAVRGFGLSLVPDWEAQQANIQSALAKAYEDIVFEYEDLVTALPDASLIDPGMYLVRRQVNLAGRLGHYPSYPARQTADKLRDAALNLIGAGTEDRLYVDVVSEVDWLRFFLNPTDLYGQPPQSP